MDTNNSASLVFVGSAVIAITAILLGFGRKSTVDGFPIKHGIPILGAWDFLADREKFVREGLSRFGGSFVFYLLNYKVLVVSGEDARRIFFQSRSLNPQEGYKVFVQSGLTVADTKDFKADQKLIEANENYLETSAKRLLLTLRPDHFLRLLPRLMSDIDRSMNRWGSEGRFDPFEDVYNMIFQLTIRMFCFAEIADSPEAVKRITELYWWAEKGTTPTSMLLPWFPSRARKLKQAAGVEIYTMLKDVYDERVAQSRVAEDTVQLLQDNGIDFPEIATFVLGNLFAGILNTGIMASWMPIFLAVNTQWRQAVMDEISTFISKYADSNSEKRTLAEQLSAVPISAWDNDLPVLEVCIRETLRLVESGCTFRRALADDVAFEGKKIEPGSFVAFLQTSAHLDENIFINPEKWDPSRFERGEDRKQQWGFVGWGVGRHPCLGMRFAQFEIKSIMILLLLQFDYTLEDAIGNPVTSQPKINRSNLHKIPPASPVYVKYQRKL